MEKANNLRFTAQDVGIDLQIEKLFSVPIRQKPQYSSFNMMKLKLNIHKHVVSACFVLYGHI
jgi:hypothetical protein